MEKLASLASATSTAHGIKTAVEQPVRSQNLQEEVASSQSLRGLFEAVGAESPEVLRQLSNPALKLSFHVKGKSSWQTGFSSDHVKATLSSPLGAEFLPVVFILAEGLILHRSASVPTWESCGLH